MATVSFKPAPNDSIEIFGERLVFSQHPGATIKIPFSQEGGRATVYEVRNPSGHRFALKVFRPSFRDPELALSGTRLAHLKSLEGLDAAERRVVLPDDVVVRRFPELEYALLMPWIEGETWAEVMLRIKDDGIAIPLGSAVHLCARFLKVVRTLEEAGTTHTDLAAGNVVVQIDPPRVQLLDLEDMYLPSSPPPAIARAGAPGYLHPAKDSVFCREGDRYAAAVLAAEILILANADFVGMASDTGVFGTHAQGAGGPERYAEVKEWLHWLSPEFSAAFGQAWHSKSLLECPAVAVLHAAIGELARRTPLEPGKVTPPPPNPNVVWVAPSGSPVSRPAPSTSARTVNPVPKSSIVKFGNNGAAPATHTGNGSVAPPTTTLTPGGTPSTGKPAKGGRSIGAGLIILLVLLVIGLILAASGCTPRHWAAAAGPKPEAAWSPGAPRSLQIDPPPTRAPGPT
jgi:hypothetical protein